MKQTPPPAQHKSGACPHCNCPDYTWGSPCPNCGWSSNKLFFLNPFFIAVALVVLGSGTCSVEYASKTPGTTIGDTESVGLIQLGTIVISAAALGLGIAFVMVLLQTGKIPLPNSNQTNKFGSKIGHKRQRSYRTICLFGAAGSLVLAALTPAVTTEFAIRTPIPYFVLAAVLSLVAFFLTPKVEGDEPPDRPDSS